MIPLELSDCLSPLALLSQMLSGIKVVIKSIAKNDKCYNKFDEYIFRVC